MRIEKAQDQAAAAVAHAGIRQIVDRIMAREYIARTFVRRQVGTGAKCTFTLARHDNGAHAVVSIGDVDGIDHLLHHDAGEGVHLFRAGEREGGDTVGSIELDLGEFGHRFGAPFVVVTEHMDRMLHSPGAKNPPFPKSLSKHAKEERRTIIS